MKKLALSFTCAAILVAAPRLAAQCNAITCPANITVSNDPNQCGAVVNYPAPTPDGTCGTITATPASGSFFPVGTTTVTATSDAGPSCTFTVTVTDTQPPTTTAPANVTVSNAPNMCGAVVNYPAPVVSDNCPGVTVLCAPASGSFFPAGSTTTTCTATDAAANTASASFSITVNDTQPPVVTCPDPVFLSVAGGTSTAVTYPPAGASDNCPGVTVACVPASGSTFPTGVTNVSCTSTDAAANTATCTFPVSVLAPGVVPVLSGPSLGILALALAAAGFLAVRRGLA